MRKIREYLSQVDKNDKKRHRMCQKMNLHFRVALNLN